MRTFEQTGEKLNAETLKSHLLTFANDLLDVLSGDQSLALNRLAIGQTSREGSKLGRMLLERGRRQMGKRAASLLEAGRRAGLLHFDSGETAYETLYGLVVADLHVRRLLGDNPDDLRKSFGTRAQKAVNAFISLYGSRL